MTTAGFMRSWDYEGEDCHYSDDSFARESLDQPEEGLTEFSINLDDESEISDILMPASAIMCAIIDEKTRRLNEEDPKLDALIDKVSLREALNRTTSKRKRLTLRPFEQYVQDILDGTRSIKDPI